MRLDRGLIGCGGLLLLLGAVALVYMLAMFSRGSERPRAVALQTLHLGPGTHRLGPYPIRPGHRARVEFEGTVTCRSFVHEGGSALQRPDFELEIKLVGFTPGGGTGRRAPESTTRGATA